MAHIVVIGAGIGGLPAAYELRGELGKEHEVTVINSREYFEFVPSNPWVAVGWRDRQGITFNLRSHLEAKGIDFICATVSAIDPRANSLQLDTGETLNYQYLVIATGPELAFDEVEGAGPAGGHTHSVCTIDHAEKAYRGYKQLLADPGHVVVGAMSAASCFGPAYEFAFILDADLRKRRMRHRVPMTFVTSEPYIGHLGLGGVGDSRSFLESDMRGHDINWITNAKVTRVDAGKMYVEEYADSGQLLHNHELEFTYSVMLPAFRGASAVAQVEGLCDPRGFVLVDSHQRSPSYPNIYAVGVSIAIPPVEATPVPTAAPKTGYMIESMVIATVRNIVEQLAGREPSAEASMNAICLADMGDTGAAFVALPQMPPRSLAWYKKGKWVHMAKIAFEKYFIRKMKKGTSEPIYEKYVLKMLGIDKLQ